MLRIVLACWVFLRFVVFSMTNNHEAVHLEQPGRQPVIETSSVKRFRRWMKIAISLRNDADPEADDALIVIIYGKSGLGKTFAIRAFLESLGERTITGLPLVLRIEIKQKVTVKGLAKQILAALGETPRSREFYDYIDEVREAILGSGVVLFILDEADRLDEETFEFLRSLTDTTRVPIALVGLPGILRVAKTHGKFQNRVAMKIQFEAIGKDELLDTFLPRLILPRWSFDPENPLDREMGMYIWQRVCPVLRRVRRILRVAGKIAAIDGSERILLKHIKETFEIDPDDQTPDAEETDAEDSDTDEIDQRHGSHEDESEQRHNAKKRKQDRGSKK